jgi:uncharacterized coiled-coil protein SlyX
MEVAFACGTTCSPCEDVMTQAQQKLSLTLALVALLVSNVSALAQTGTTGATQQPTPAGGLDLSPANGGSVAAPPASIDVSDEIQASGIGNGVRPIEDFERTPKQLGEQNIIVTASEATRLRELELKVGRLEQLIEAQSAALQDMADKMTAPAEELRAIREELTKLNSRQTVARPELDSGNGDDAPSLASVGKLKINNHTNIAYTMSVNGRPFIIMPGTGEIAVEYGPVTTEIVGYEAPKSWAQTDWREENGQQQLAIQIR